MVRTMQDITQGKDKDVVFVTTYFLCKSAEKWIRNLNYDGWSHNIKCTCVGKAGMLKMCKPNKGQSITQCISQSI